MNWVYLNYLIYTVIPTPFSNLPELTVTLVKDAQEKKVHLIVAGAGTCNKNEFASTAWGKELTDGVVQGLKVMFYALLQYEPQHKEWFDKTFA